jgi:hypothetical protein
MDVKNIKEPAACPVCPGGGIWPRTDFCPNCGPTPLRAGKRPLWPRCTICSRIRLFHQRICPHCADVDFPTPAEMQALIDAQAAKESKNPLTARETSNLISKRTGLKTRRRRKKLPPTA